jgi:predicted membrane protein
LLAALGERVGQELGALGGLTQRVQDLEVEVGRLFVWGVCMRVVHAPIMALPEDLRKTYSPNLAEGKFSEVA